MQDRFKRLTGLFPVSKPPKKQFLVSITDIDEDGAEEVEDGVFEAGAWCLTLMVDERDLPAVQRVLNNNGILYTTQPYDELAGDSCED